MGQSSELENQQKVLERRCVAYNTQIVTLRECIVEQKTKVQDARNECDQMQARLDKQNTLIEAQNARLGDEAVLKSDLYAQIRQLEQKILKKDQVIATELENIRTYKDQFDRLSQAHAKETKATQTKQQGKDQKCQTHL